MFSLNRLPDPPAGPDGRLGNRPYPPARLPYLPAGAPRTYTPGPVPFPRSVNVRVWSDGSLVELCAPDGAISPRDELDPCAVDPAISPRDELDPSEGDPAISPRGAVSFLSSKARQRMSRVIARVRSSVPFHFLTLTYPGHPSRWDHTDPAIFPPEGGPPVPLPGPRSAKRDLDALFKVLARLVPAASGVWKLEPQERGVPHFHVILYGVPDDPVIIEALHLAWFRIAGRGDPEHILHGFDMPYLSPDDTDDAFKARLYLAKYVSKDGPKALNPDIGVYASASPGRFWGIHNRAAIPWSPRYDLLADDAHVALVYRLFRRLVNAKQRAAFWHSCARLLWFKGEGGPVSAVFGPDRPARSVTKRFRLWVSNGCTVERMPRLRRIRWRVGTVYSKAPAAFGRQLLALLSCDPPASSFLAWSRSVSPP